MKTEAQGQREKKNLPDKKTQADFAELGSRDKKNSRSIWGRANERMKKKETKGGKKRRPVKNKRGNSCEKDKGKKRPIVYEGESSKRKDRTLFARGDGGGGRLFSKDEWEGKYGNGWRVKKKTVSCCLNHWKSGRTLFQKGFSGHLGHG